MNDIDRRAFLKGLAAASAAPLLPAAGAAPAGAIPMVPRAPTWSKAPCTLCSVGCGLLVAVENGRAVALKGDPDSPVGRGLACVKGYHSVQSLYGGDRITRAMVRRDGRLVSVRLSDALDLVARRLREAVAAHGKGSVALYGGGLRSITDEYIGAKLFRKVLGSGDVDTSARLSVGMSTGMTDSFGRAGAAASYDDIETADVFVLWGANVAETHPVLFSRILERRRTDPAVRIVDVSTRTTRTSYASDRALLHPPFAETALANAICADIISRHAERRDFIDRHVSFRRGTSLPLARPQDGLVAEAARDATWSDFVGLLEEYAPSRARTTTRLPVEDVAWLASLYADRARRVLSIAGEGIGRSTSAASATSLICNIHLLTGKVGEPGNGVLPLVASVGMPEPPADVQAPGKSVGRDAVAIFDSLGRGDTRFLWIQGSDPVAELPSLKALDSRRGADRFIVVSAAYPTASTDAADVVLPSALWIEDEGTFMSAEQRVQHVPQLLRPPGDATSEGWQVAEVARRLGFAGELPWDRSGFVGGAWNEYRRLAAAPGRTLPSLAELRRTDGTPAARWTPGSGQRATIWLRPHAPPPEIPDHEFPFWLEAGSVLEHSGTGTITRRIPVLHRAMPRAYVELHADDARRLGIRDGDALRITSRRGSIQLPARVDHRSQPQRGQLFVPAFDDGAVVTRLMPDGRCPHTGQPEVGRCAVRIDRATGRGDA